MGTIKINFLDLDKIQKSPFQGASPVTRCALKIYFLQQQQKIWLCIDVYKKWYLEFIK